MELALVFIRLMSDEQYENSGTERVNSPPIPQGGYKR